MKRVLSGMMILTLSIFVVSMSWADVVELKTGERVEGKIQQASPTGVVLEVGGQKIRFETEKVKAIYFGNVPVVQSNKPSLAGESIGALKALQSMTTVNVNYRDYSQYVNNTKIQVDRYIEDPGKEDSEIKQKLRQAIGYHFLASRVWGLSLQGILGKLQAAKMISEELPPPSECSVNNAVESMPGEAVKSLWSCASRKISEAEKMLSEQKR